MNMEVNQITNKTNLKIFSRYGLKEPHRMRHKCVLCGESTSVDSSFSDQGSRMICKDCACSKFDSIMEILEWVKGENND